MEGKRYLSSERYVNGLFNMLSVVRVNTIMDVHRYSPKLVNQMYEAKQLSREKVNDGFVTMKKGFDVGNKTSIWVI